MQPSSIFLILLLTVPPLFANNVSCNCNNSTDVSENVMENLALSKDAENSTEIVVDEEFAVAFSEFFEKVSFRNKVNFTRAQEIYLVEAKRLGLTPLEHLKNCGKVDNQLIHDVIIVFRSQSHPSLCFDQVSIFQSYRRDHGLCAGKFPRKGPALG